VIPAEFDPLLAAGNRSTRRDGALEYTFRGQPAAKHALEALGIPHTEVAGVQADGGILPLNYHLVDGDHLQVIPISSRPPGVPLHPGPEALFIVDNHLGKLATYLRMLGFDCLYEPALDDPELAERASATGRVLVTRDRRLLMRRALEFGCWVRSREPVAQVRQVLLRYDLRAKIQLFQRCLRCNHPLEAVSKAAVLHRLEPLTRQYYDEFSTCPACNQVYWAGSHYAHMQALAAEILDGPQAL
jgi:uncharacterized protein